MKNYTDNQRKTLSLLLDKYEISKTYKGTNKVQQSFYISPEQVWKDYVADYTDVELIKDFEYEMMELQAEKLIELHKIDDTLNKLVAVEACLDKYYKILGRKPKNDFISEQNAFFKEWREKNIPVITPYCIEQLERILMNKKPVYDINISEKIFRILEFLQNNNEDILERELSIAILSDSKLFGKTYRSKVCKLLLKYKDFSDRLLGVDDDREREKIILEEYCVYANPSYVHIKGHCHITMKDGMCMGIRQEPVALSTDFLRNVEIIQVATNNIMTVENLTSFHRVCANDCTYIYLAGYHNSAKQALLKRISKNNPKKIWFHFGDIDPDGFYIMEHLKRGTGIEFESYNMSVEQLRKFNAYCKPLTDNDRTKANNLIALGKHVEVMKYILENNCKLEQEIISWDRS